MPDPTKSCKPAILKVAVSLARSKGLFVFSCLDVATAAEVGISTVFYHFGTMAKLRTAIVEYAVQKEILSILADATTGRENVGVNISKELLKKVAASITTA